MAASADELRNLESQIERLAVEVEQVRQRLRQLENGSPPDLKSEHATGETPFGLAAVNRIGAITLVIGIIYFFKYAVDNEWIGADGRLLLGVAAGSLMIAAGVWLSLRGQQIFSQGITGCGLATFYVTCYTAFAWYGSLSTAAAAAALVAVSGLAVALSLRQGHQAVAALGLTGGLLTPILLRGTKEPAHIILPYLFLIDLTCVLMVYKRRWTLLAPLIGAQTILGALFLTPSSQQDWFAGFALVLAAVHLIAAAYAGADARLHRAFYATGHGFIVLGVLREVNLWTRRTVAEPARGSAESEFGSLFLAGYGIAAMAWGVVRRSPISRTLSLVVIGVVIAKLYLWDIWFLARFYRMSAFVALGVLLLASSWIYSRGGDTR